MTALKAAGWPYELEDAETLNYQSYTCRGCGINDRDRLYLLYLEQQLPEDVPIRLVEFAPSAALRSYLQRRENVHHRTADLWMDGVDDRLDLQDLSPYADETFDFFVCSHVLEHVNDDLKAMSELYRILKNGGRGIAMVPIVNKVDKTVEAPGLNDPQQRVRLFGQDDHVRLYAKPDFISRLQSAGFRIELLDRAYFGADVFERNGISHKSVLYVVHK
jgi:SAM-dependent methyltransferase